ncbi:MAG: MFS transporter, partial [Chloroflexota bacterium]
MASLRHRDFRLLMLGQLVSTVGDAMQSIGIAWHAYVLTNSPLQLGLLGLLRAVPFMVFSFVGGALADSMDRKRLLIVTQSSQMLLTSGLVAATASGHVTVWLLYLVTFLSGAASAFDSPARQAIIPNLVPREEMTAAMTLLTLLRRTAMIVGPGIGGLVIGRFGLSWNYLGNALSFLAVVAAVLLLGPVPRTRLAAGRNWERLTAGLTFARKEPLVILPMLMDFITRGCGSTNTLLPIFARDVFAVGAEGLGVLSAGVSAGALAAGLVLGSVRQVKHPLVLMVGAYAAEGLFLACLGFSRTFSLALVALFLKGVVNVIGEVLRVTVMQLKTPDEVRGRVTALSGIFDVGGPNIGGLESGVVADVIGPIGAAVTGGLASAALAIAFGFAPGLR